MKRMLWCSPHTPTEEQVVSLSEMGEVIFLRDINPELQEKIANCPMDSSQVEHLARQLAGYPGDHSQDYVLVQPAGSPAFQHMLGRIMAEWGWKKIIYAHSERVSVDEPQADGSIKKISVFKHMGWVEC